HEGSIDFLYKKSKLKCSSISYEKTMIIGRVIPKGGAAAFRSLHGNIHFLPEVEGYPNMLGLRTKWPGAG
ncbi:MAG: hypothetical protein LUG19_03705, partial [Desulfovibrio sp.]|uniref:hypothetical protein n=1 Tax=Desulfovibrio sp. TaxID=885 RepID=UPI0025840D96